VSAHALFAPSAAYRWTQCAASVRLGASLPRAPSSVYAEEGSLMHECAAEMLSGKPGDSGRSEGLPYDAKQAILSYVGYVASLRSQPGFAWGKVEVSLGSRESDLFGTADFLCVIGDTLHVVDFKGGAGVVVAVLDNPQMLTYALLALRYGDLTDVKQVRMTIVQPRGQAGEPIRSHTFDLLELADWGLTVRRARKAALAPDAPYKSGDHCRWCPAAHVCPALKSEHAGLSAAQPADLSPAQLAAELDACELVEIRIKALREFATMQIAQGIRLPGWVLRPLRAVRKWINETNAANKLRSMGVDPYEQKLISVAVADKALKKRFGELAGLWSNESSGVTLDRGESPPAVNVGAVIEKAAK